MLLAVQMPPSLEPTECPSLAQLLIASVTILNYFERKDVLLGSSSDIHYSETRQEPFLLGKECLQTLTVKGETCLAHSLPLFQLKGARAG